MNLQTLGYARRFNLISTKLTDALFKIKPVFLVYGEYDRIMFVSRRAISKGIKDYVQYLMPCGPRFTGKERGSITLVEN